MSQVCIAKPCDDARPGTQAGAKRVRVGRELANDQPSRDASQDTQTVNGTQTTQPTIGGGWVGLRTHLSLTLARGGVTGSSRADSHHSATHRIQGPSTRSIHAPKP